MIKTFQQYPRETLRTAKAGFLTGWMTAVPQAKAQEYLTGPHIQQKTT